MRDNFEVITTTNKEQRDRMFRDFRKSDDPLERQVVKFSSVQRVPDSLGNKWQSTWSVAYPKS